MSMHKLASCSAHSILTRLIEADAMPPAAETTASARSEEHGMQVIVIIAPYDGPMRLPPEIVAKIEAARPPAPKLTPMMEQIVALLSREKPAKCEWLAAKLGKKAGGSFRSLCADLVRLGVARHVKGLGYFLP